MASMQEYQDRIAPSRTELLFGLFALWTYEGAFFNLFRASVREGAELGASDPVTRAANIAVLCGVLFLLARRRMTLGYLRRHARLHGLIVLYCLATALWSLYPVTTLRRSLSLATAFGFGFYAVIAYGPRGFVRLYGWSLFVAAFASLAAPALFGAKAYDNAGLLGGAAVRSFHGVFAQKNELSVEMLMGVCCWCWLGLLTPKRGELERFAWPLALLSVLVALIYSKGTTSILAAALVASAVCGMLLPGWRGRLALYAGLAGALLVLVAVALVAPELLFGLLGKDTTLTGRIPLWIESMQSIQSRPWFGYGYNAFWRPDSVLTQYIWQRIGWQAPNAHNGVLQLALDLGLLGGAMYLFMMLRFALRALRALGDPGFPEAKFVALAALAMLVESLDEGTTAWPDALAIVVAYASATTSIWRAGAWPLPFAHPGARASPALGRFGVTGRIAHGISGPSGSARSPYQKGGR